MKEQYNIIEAVSNVHVAMARDLFKEYASSVGVDLSFQGFPEELKGLPGRYSPPRGGLFLAMSGDSAAGCVALRPLDTPGVAELKRLYVRPRHRGHGLGLALTNHAITRALELGFTLMRLDTLPSMRPAQELYRRIGFREIPAYTFNPVPGTTYMELNIGDKANMVHP